LRKNNFMEPKNNKQKSNSIFLILGYGVPKDIIKDENYNIYLKTAFNAIFSVSAKEKTNPIIIFCGGKTDCFAPYKRNEADEMIRLFQKLMQRRHVKDLVKDWKLISEKTSISTLENLLDAKKMIDKKNIKSESVHIISEVMRKKRIETLAKKIFSQKITLISIDFSQSPTRFLDPHFVQKKEDQALAHDMEALKNENLRSEHHKVYVEKLEIFRKVKSADREDAIRKWWESVFVKNNYGK